MNFHECFVNHNDVEYHVAAIAINDFIKVLYVCDWQYAQVQQDQLPDCEQFISAVREVIKTDKPSYSVNSIREIEDIETLMTEKELQQFEHQIAA